ncbi:MAG: FHA domain-containing protein [Actinomycetota bacterium]|nr:FHA domain-containing protein [Actinomycetota bacterium]
MSYVFCNQCGHRNPPGASFCSSCGGVLDLPDERTVVIAQVDPMQDAPGSQDNATIRLGDVSGLGVLVIRSGDLTGARFTISKGTTKIGRNPDSDILFDDISVSRSHAEIVNSKTGLVVRDLGSLNGTYINQNLTEQSSLRHGDELQIGRFRMVFFSKADISS